MKTKIIKQPLKISRSSEPLLRCDNLKITGYLKIYVLTVCSFKIIATKLFFLVE